MSNARGPIFALFFVLPIMIAANASAFAQDATPEPVSTMLAGEPGRETILQATVGELPALPVVVGLTRWTYQPGTSADLVVAGPEIYAVESGMLGIRVDGDASILRAGAASFDVATPDIDVTLLPGDQAIVAADVPHTLHNDGDEPAQFLNIVMFPASSMLPSWLPDPETAPGTSARNLFTDVITDADAFPAGSVNITLERHSIVPEARLTTTDMEGLFLVLVESGTLGVDLDEADAQRIRAGEIVRLTPELSRAARNAGDDLLVALVLRVQPAETDVDIPSEATPSA